MAAAGAFAAGAAGAAGAVAGAAGAAIDADIAVLSASAAQKNNDDVFIRVPLKVGRLDTVSWDAMVIKQKKGTEAVKLRSLCRVCPEISGRELLAALRHPPALHRRQARRHPAAEPQA